MYAEATADERRASLQIITVPARLGVGCESRLEASKGARERAYRKIGE